MRRKVSVFRKVKSRHKKHLTRSRNLSTVPKVLHGGIDYDGKHNPKGTYGHWSRVLIGKGFWSYRVLYVPKNKQKHFGHAVVELNFCARNEKEVIKMFKKAKIKGTIISIELSQRDNYIGNSRALNVGSPEMALAFDVLAGKKK